MMAVCGYVACDAIALSLPAGVGRSKCVDYAIDELTKPVTIQVGDKPIAIKALAVYSDAQSSASSPVVGAAASGSSASTESCHEAEPAGSDQRLLMRQYACYTEGCLVEGLRPGAHDAGIYTLPQLRKEVLAEFTELQLKLACGDLTAADFTLGAAHCRAQLNEVDAAIGIIKPVASSIAFFCRHAKNDAHPPAGSYLEPSKVESYALKAYSSVAGRPPPIAERRAALLPALAALTSRCSSQ